MIEIHLYGELRQLAPGVRVDEETVIRVVPEPGETLFRLLARVGVSLEGLAHIFLNGNLLATHNAMAPWLRYPQARERVWDWDTDHAVQSGDRIGLFGEDMALLVV